MKSKRCKKKKVANQTHLLASYVICDCCPDPRSLFVLYDKKKKKANVDNGDVIHASVLQYVTTKEPIKMRLIV